MVSHILGYHLTTRLNSSSLILLLMMVLTYKSSLFFDTLSEDLPFFCCCCCCKELVFSFIEFINCFSVFSSLVPFLSLFHSSFVC